MIWQKRAAEVHSIIINPFAYYDPEILDARIHVSSAIENIVDRVEYR